MKRISIIIFLLLVGLCHLQAQEDPTTAYNNWVQLGNQTIPTPTVAGLAKVTDFPISYYTGSPNISIPLYTINTGKLTWPITLDYNSTGIRVNENSGNVGLSWNIRAEGAIMQSVLGIKDNSTYQSDGLSYTSNQLLPNTPANANLLNILSLNHTDGAPDLYMYNFGNYSGKFIVANEVKTMPRKNLVISSFQDSNNQKCWKIIAEDGNVYFFTAMETMVSRSSAGAPESYNWLLTKIMDPNGLDSIIFQYSDTYCETDIAKDYVVDSYRDTFGVNWSVDMAPNDAPIPGHLTTYSQRNIGKQLSKIIFNNGTIEYDIALNDRQDLSGYGSPLSSGFKVPRVKNIFVKNAAGSIIKTIHFEQDYFVYPGSTTLDGKRLRLSSISFVPQLADLNTPIEEKYTFQYNSNYALPLKSSNGLDHWGYNNGKDQNHGLIPSIHTQGMDYYGADRATDPTRVIVGMLEHMTYPTGGTTDFAWECHSGNNVSSGQVLIHVDSNIDLQLISSHNDNSVSGVSSEIFTIPDNDSFNFLESNFTVSAGYPSGSTSQTITHAASKGLIYRIDGASQVLVAAIAFAYNTSNNYSNSEPVQLQRGKTYMVTAQTTGPIGCSVHAKLTMEWPAIGPAGGGGGPYFVGGCRIKQITMRDQYGSPNLIKTFAYSNAATFRSPVYYTNFYQYYSEADPDGTIGPGFGCIYLEQKGLMLNSNSFTNIGSGVGYDWVKEYNGTTGGYTMYSYSNFDYNFPGDIDASWRRGILLGTKIYDNNGAIIKETINHNKRVTSESFAGHTAGNMGIHPCFDPNNAPSDFPAHYTQKVYSFPIDWQYVDTMEDIDYVSGVHSLVVNNFDNPQHQEVTRATSFGSDGSKLTTFIKYPTDFTVNSSQTLYTELDGIKLLQDKHINNYPLEQYSQRWLPGASTPITLSARYNKYLRGAISSMLVPNTVLLNSVNAIDNASSDGISNFLPMSIVNNVLSKDSRYIEKTLAKEIDEEGNINEVINNKIEGNGLIWGFRNKNLIAQVKNNDTSITRAFTSFELNESGNWSYASSSVSALDALTGKNCLMLSVSSNLKINFPNNAWADLPPVLPNSNLSGNYIISYWHKSGSVFVNGTSPTKTGPTAKGWTYCEHIINNPTGSINVNGSGLIDEVRFYPESSTMKSYTYIPLIGIGSYDDETNHILFYEYDAMGRLKYEKDVFGNIIQFHEYQYQGLQ